MERSLSPPQAEGPGWQTSLLGRSQGVRCCPQQWPAAFSVSAGPPHGVPTYEPQALPCGSPAPSGTSGRHTAAGLWPRLGSRRALPRKRRVSCALKQERGSSGQRGRDCRGEEEHVQRPRGSPGCELSWSRARHEPSRAETPRGTREPQKSLSEILLNAQGRVDPALAPEEAGPVGG